MKSIWFRRILLAAVVILLLAAIFPALRYYRYFSSHVSTDDAYVDGSIGLISSRITGTVIKVFVSDNWRVKAGDILLELDPSDYQVQVDGAAGPATARAPDCRPALCAGRGRALGPQARRIAVAPGPHRLRPGQATEGTGRRLQRILRPGRHGDARSDGDSRDWPIINWFRPKRHWASMARTIRVTTGLWSSRQAPPWRLRGST